MLLRYSVQSNSSQRPYPRRLNPRRAKLRWALLSLALFSLSTTLGASPGWAYTMAGPQYAEDPVKVAARERQAALERERLLAQQAQAQAEAEAAKRAALLEHLRPNPTQENAELKELISSGQEALLVYGGHKYQVFLGCLNCAPSMHISLWKRDGPYGSALSQFSIWSDFYEFGNAQSHFSPWNRYGAQPPVVVTPQGKFYGRLSANPNLEQCFANNFTYNLVTLHHDIKRDPQLWFELAFKDFLPAAAQIPVAEQESAGPTISSESEPAAPAPPENLPAAASPAAAKAPAVALSRAILELMPRAPQPVAIQTESSLSVPAQPAPAQR